MRTATLLILGAALLTGCVSPPPQPEEVPAVTDDDYDLLWDATVEVVQKHFDLFVRRKDEGYIVSEYKRGEPLPGGNLKRDAQTGYDVAEEFMHIVRRRLTARVVTGDEDRYVVLMEIVRERQGYVPPPPEYGSPYSLHDYRKRQLSDTADQGATVTWQSLGRDVTLENRLLREIEATVAARKTQVKAQ